MEGPLLTVWPVLTEAFYLLGFSWKAQDNLWEYLARGRIEVAGLERSAQDRCRTLMSKYRDLPMDLADASMVAVAEAKKVKSIFTLDHKDFNLYRPSHIKRFELIPKQLS